MKRRIKENYRTPENPTTLSIDEITNAYKSVIGKYVKALIGKIFGGSGRQHITGDKIVDDVKDLTNVFNDSYRQDLTANNIVPIVDFDLGIPETRRLKKYGQSCTEITSVAIIAIDAQDGGKTLFTIHICSDRLPTQNNLFTGQITGARLDKDWNWNKELNEHRKGKIMKITLKELKNLIKEAVNEVNVKRFREMKRRERESSPEE